MDFSEDTALEEAEDKGGRLLCKRKDRANTQ